MHSLLNGTAGHPSPATRKHMASKFKSVAAAVAIGMSGVSLPAFAQHNAISTGYLTGTWKDNAQCRGREAMVFFQNQTFSSAGSIPVNYAVTGPSQFTMHGAGGAASIQAQYLNQNQMLVTLNNNSSVFYRCGGGNAQPAYTPPLTVTYIVGGWTHNGNCGRPEVFQPGGRFQTSQNATGAWTLFGNVLRMMPANGVNAEFVVQVNGPGNMVLTQSNGQVSYYTRCY